MKNKLLLITLLAGLTSGASAAVSATGSPVLVLPTFVVNAPRTSPAERQINLQREEFVRQALAPRTILPEAARFQFSAEPAVRLTGTIPAKAGLNKTRS